MNYTLIFPASSGIGCKQLKLFAEKENDLILIEKKENKLKQIAKELNSSHDINVGVIQQDLYLSNAIETIFNKVNEWGLTICNLLNYTGFCSSVSS